MPTTTCTKDLIANFIVASSAYEDIEVSVFLDDEQYILDCCEDFVRIASTLRSHCSLVTNNGTKY